MANVIVSKHANERLSERGGFKNSSKDRIAKIAFEKGIDQKEANGALQKLFVAIYLKSKTQYNNNKVIVKIYGRQIYIFNYTTQVLITVLPVDKKYYQAIDKIMKKKKEDIDNEKAI